MKILNLTLRILIAILYLQTLFFKFTASPESVYIFTQLQAEPYGRILSGIMELICIVLLILPQTYLFGAILSLGIISGAILSHIFILGVVVQNDDGLLFGLALIIFFASAYLILSGKAQILEFINKNIRRTK
jgi:uncharacterized membrane protein YphA (DoxX/SURF4 family)